MQEACGRVGMNELKIKAQSVLYPGAHISEVVEAFSLSVAEVSEQTGIPEDMVHRVLRGEASVGRPMEFWLGIREAYDEARLRHGRSSELMLCTDGGVVQSSAQ
jgi:hypothetical protein